MLRLAHQKLLVNPLELVINQNINVNNLEVLFYVLSDQMRQSGRTFYMSKQPDKLLMYSFHGQFTVDSQDSSAFCLTLQETPCLQYKFLALDKYFREEFIKCVEKCLQIDLKLQDKQIKIIAIEKGSIKVIFKVIDSLETVHLSENSEELEKQFPGCKPSLQLHNFFETALLSVDDFDYNHNMTWDNFSFGRYDNRGPKDKPQPYFFPIGWKGYALNVANKYGDNANWLMMDGNKDEWYVMFHGTTFGGVQAILQGGTNIRPGRTQAYRNKDCMRTKDKDNNPVKIGEGVYFSNHIEISGQYSKSRENSSNVPTPIGDKKFLVAFQSRVRPEALRQCKKCADSVLVNKIAEHKKNNPSYNKNLDNMDLWNNDYFVINKTEDIRPYRILLKEITEEEK